MTMARRQYSLRTLLGVVAVVAVCAWLLGTVWPWLEHRRSVGVLLDAVEDSEDSALREVSALETTWPAWREAKQIDRPLYSDLWFVSAQIATYRMRVDIYNAVTGDDRAYDAKLLAIEQEITTLSQIKTEIDPRAKASGKTRGGTRN
jgi:hypothetical protein